MTGSAFLLTGDRDRESGAGKGCQIPFPKPAGDISTLATFGFLRKEDLFHQTN